MFVKTLILNHFDSEYYICIKTDTSGYAISEIFSQLTLDDLDQWYLMAFFFQKRISAEIKNETYNKEFLTIIKAFKTWKYYLEDCKHKVFVLTDYNNL